MTATAPSRTSPRKDPYVPDLSQVDAASRPALTAMLRAMPGGINAIPDLAGRRATADRLDLQRRVESSPRVAIEDTAAPSSGGHRIPVRVYRPEDRDGRLPVVFFIHGGGMVMGSLDGGDPIAVRLAEELHATVVSVGYRLAPEHPYPAAVDDCVDALAWVIAESERLGADPARLVVFGGSAGGGLALATALRCRDGGGPRPLLVMAPYPMIDHTGAGDSTRRLPDLGAWDRANNAEAWGWYLGGRPADGYAAPAHAPDVSGLPPTFLDVGTQDIFLDETVDFARRLFRAGVPAELHVYPGAYHASEDLAPDAPLSQTIWATRLAALRRALGGCEANS
jgi:acetyl esterase/lipase